MISLLKYLDVCTCFRGAVAMVIFVKWCNYLMKCWIYLGSEVQLHLFTKYVAVLITFEERKNVHIHRCHTHEYDDLLSTFYNHRLLSDFCGDYSSYV